jgi:DEAD/DEAH box helicase domain-containing protein
LPIADNDDIDTLTACIILGLRLRFEGNPAHLIVTPQSMPDMATRMRRYYLMLLDGVPGGTGYLKTLYQEKDALQREGEGLLQVLRLAKNALETCVCRQLRQQLNKQDTDGCYRCIRTYQLQHNANKISREKGITLLGQLIEAGEKRVPQRELEAIRPNSLFGSMLEKKFVDVLRAFVQQKNGTWEQTIIRGSTGYRFSLPGTDHLWELELQPRLGTAQGVMIQSQPDFLLRSDADRIKPIAIFTDGFQFHCHPTNRLADDFQKRRAILASGNYHVWNITWDDLNSTHAEHVMTCHEPVAQRLHLFATAMKDQGLTVPDARSVVRNGLEQLKAFLATPHAAGWSQLANYAAYFPLQLLSTQRAVGKAELRNGLEQWRTGAALPALNQAEQGNWVYNDRASLNQDFLTCITLPDAISNRQNQTLILGRLGDTEAECSGSDYQERWRRFLAGLNFYQFCGNILFWTSAEAHRDLAPEIPFHAAATIPDEWKTIQENVLPSMRVYVQELASVALPATVKMPVVEYFNEEMEDDAFAELAWPEQQPPVAILAGDQMTFQTKWQQQGWKIVTADDLQAKGIGYLLDQFAK